MYPTVFPRNQWYVAGHSDGFGRQLRSQWILGEPVCFYRKLDGAPVALTDRCVHRQMPLSLGRLRGDELECRYHGITYGPDGRALRVPSQDRIPAGCQVHRYPLTESGGLIWIWMGDARQADATLLPAHPWLDSPGWAVERGTLHMNARAQLLNENLLDLTHVGYLHDDSIGTDEVAGGAAVTEADGQTVRVTRRMPGVQCPPLFQRAMGLSGLIDRESVAEFVAPGFHISHVWARPAGDPQAGPRTCRHKAIHCITPEHETTAHYFWAVARDYRIDDPQIGRLWREGPPKVLQQDIDAAEAIERVISGPGYPSEINLRADGGALRARRIIERLVAAEGAAEPARA